MSKQDCVIQILNSGMNYTYTSINLMKHLLKLETEAARPNEKAKSSRGRVSEITFML